MSIVEKLGGKPGQQTISEAMGSGKSSSSVPFIGDIYEFLANHSDRYMEKGTWAWIQYDSSAEPNTHFCFEVDEEAFNTLNESFVCILSTGTSPVVKRIKPEGESINVPLDPADFNFTDSVVISAAEFISISLHQIAEEQASCIFKKGTLHISEGTKGKQANPTV